MAGIWIILLDVSGSMSGSIGDRIARLSKIDTAKSALLKEISSLPDNNVAIVAFNTTATSIFYGRANETSLIQRSLQQLRVGGSTDIAHALRFAKDNYRTFSPVNILDIIGNKLLPLVGKLSALV